MPKTYGYLKTNVDVKDLMPQIEILKSHGVTDQNLFSDPIVAGKTYPGPNALIGKLRRKGTFDRWLKQDRESGSAPLAD